MSASEISTIDRGTATLHYGKEAERYAAATTSSGFYWLKASLWGPYKTCMMIGTVVNIIRHPNVPRSEQVPRLQSWFEKATHFCGLNDSYPFITEVHFPDYPWYKKEVFLMGYTMNIYLPKPPVVTAHLANHEALSAAIFEPHRLEAFAGTKAGKNIIEILGQIFTGVVFDVEDTMFTCGAEFTQKVHAAIANGFRKANLQDIIEAEGKALIDRWIKKEGAFDLTRETQVFTSNIILKTFFGAEWEVFEEVHFMNGYLFSKATKIFTSKQAETDFTTHSKKFRSVTEEILTLDEKRPLPLFEGADFSLAQKLALIFSLFFAGQETSSFGLDYIFAYLALNPEEQEKLYQAIKDKKIENLRSIPEYKEFIDDRLLEIPPAAAVGREAEGTTILSFEVEGKKLEKIIRDGEILGGSIAGPAGRILAEKKANQNISQGTMLYNKANVFGKGAHLCQGMNLALKELFILPFLVLRNFKLKTDEEKFSYCPKITNQADPFQLEVEIRS